DPQEEPQKVTLISSILNLAIYFLVPEYDRPISQSLGHHTSTHDVPVPFGGGSTRNQSLVGRFEYDRPSAEPAQTASRQSLHYFVNL
ncbi:hypothetical protein ON021_19865, partial [Microcoleus sp. HI-ES]|nr:hypothetical protein [Microcoleus sp. HI-ES]